MIHSSTREPEPQGDSLWHRNPMVWFIIALPMTAVIASLITLVIAYRHAPIVLPATSPPVIETDQQLPPE